MDGIDRRRTDPTPATGLIAAALLAAAWGLAGPAGPARAEQLTNNAVNDFWSPMHSTVVGEHMLWTEDNQEVVYWDGATATPLQDRDPLDPTLDFVAEFVFGLGSGASADEVVGAWRRGSDHAWVWTSGEDPVLVDTHGTHPWVPDGATNPEGVAIADGCVFLITQAQDPDDGTGNVYKNVWQVDPGDGSVSPVSGPTRAFGAERVVTDGCRAAWVWEPNDSIVVGDQPYELHYWDGAQTVVLDRANQMAPRDIAFARDTIVYLKEVEGRRQVFRIDVSDPQPTPVQLSDSLADKHAPATDGRHVAWGEEFEMPGGPVLLDIVLEGGLRVTRATHSRPAPGTHAFRLDGGQLAWRLADPLAVAPLVYVADNALQVSLDPGDHSPFQAPHLSDGWIAWYGPTGGSSDLEVHRHAGSPPQDLDLAPPPMWVEADVGPTSLTVRWNAVQGVDGATVYLANEPGVGPQSWSTLAGGARLDGVASPLVVDAIDPTLPWHVTVTTTEGGVEGPPSAEIAPWSFLVETTDDTVDAIQTNGICADALGRCSLRAALSEAARLEQLRPATIALPAGTYALTRTGDDDTGLAGDLDVRNAMALVGAGVDQTVLQGLGPTVNEPVLDLNPNGLEIEIRLADLTVAGGDTGIENRADLRLERVRVRDNGVANGFASGAAIAHTGAALVAVDSELDGNATGSHGGALFVTGTRTDLRRTEIHDNTAGLGGGAMYLFSRDIRLTECTLRDNTTRNAQNWAGGAIYMEGGTVLLRGSAVVGNDTPDCGGGIYTGGGELTLRNSTVSGNHADDAGGAICARGGDDLDLIHATLANNTAGIGPTLDLGSGLSLGLISSLFDNPAGAEDCRFDGSLSISSSGLSLGDLQGCTGDSPYAVDLDPRLDVLADNGGPTPTHALLDDSPALDAVPDGECVDRRAEPVARDQRGNARPVDRDGDGLALCDAGAVEADVACVDDDGDGFPAASNPGCLAGTPADCDDGDGGSWALPGEDRALRFDAAETLRWDAPADPGGIPGALVHEVLRAEAAFDLSAGAACGALAAGATEVVDPVIPASGGLFVYLVRATNGCGAAPGWGTASDGQTREAACASP